MRDAGMADVQARQYNFGSTGGLLGGWPQKEGSFLVGPTCSACGLS